MKKLFYPAFIAICLSACSSSAPDESVNMSANIRTNVNLSELNNPNVNAQPAANENKELQGSIFYDKDGKQVTVKSNAGNAAPPAPIDPKAKPISMAAPDNSEIMTTMNNQGQPVEIRSFRNNPILAKVERVYVTTDQPVVIAYLKDGQKVNLTAAKIEDPMKSSAEDIISAVNAGKTQPITKKQP